MDRIAIYCRKKGFITALLCFILFVTLGCGTEWDGGRENGPVSEEAAQVEPDKVLPESSLLIELSQKKDSSKFPPKASPEVLSLALSPQIVFPGTPIRAKAEAYEAGGNLVFFDYEWHRNGEVLSGEFLNELDSSSFQKGDLISVTLTPFVGEVRGEAKRSNPVVILNRPPEITSFPPPAGVAGKYVYEISVFDPDEDILEFSLEEAPVGMTIDKGTGRLQWDMPTGLEGEFQVRIIVSDGDARAFQGFVVRLKKG